MDSILLELLKVGGQAGILWVALFYMSKTIKGQYEARIEVLEEANKRHEEDKMKLHERIEEILLRQIERWNSHYKD